MLRVVLPVALLTALVFVPLIAVMLVRTALFASKQPPILPAQPIQLDAVQASGRLAGAIRIQTVSFQDETQINHQAFLDIHEYLSQAFPRVHGTLTREIVGKYSLLYTWTGTNKELKPVLLLGHLDVVPVEPVTETDWPYPPFGGHIADGYIWGRGAMDMKVAVTGILEAVELLLAEGYVPHRTVYLAFGHDEELEGEAGAVPMAALLESRGVKPEYILDEGLVITDGILPGASAPVALVGIAERGYLSLELSSRCAPGHSYAPPPQTCIGIISAAIHNLERHPIKASLNGPTALMFDYVGPEMSLPNRLVFANLWLFRGLVEKRLASSPATNAAIRTTGAATIIHGGIKENVLPASATATINFRIRPGDSVANVVDHVRRVIADPRVTITPLPLSREPSPVTAADSSSFQLVASAIRQVFPETVVAPSLVTAATDARHYTGLTNNIYRFLPLRMGLEDLGRIHGTGERVSMENYAEIIQFYAQLIKNSK
jgi:carboxypeptidase PM20D1